MQAMADGKTSTSLDALTFLWLEITNKCNLTCTHCYADSGPTGDLYGSMAYDDWLRVLDEAADVGCRRTQFIGGEPTLHPRLPDLVEHANYRGFSIEVFTNATRLQKELLTCFQRNRVEIATSFYSDDRSVHEQITQSEGSWQRTVSGIRSVVAAGLPIRVGVIETDRNHGHAQRAIAFVRALGVESVGLDRERGVGRGAHIPVTSDEEQYEELCGQCWKGKLCVTSSGSTFPCVFARVTSLGNARAGLVDILRSPKLAAFRSAVQARGPNLADSGGMCSPDETIIPCYPDQPCSPKNPCWPDNAPCWPDKPPAPPPCTPKDPCMPQS